MNSSTGKVAKWAVMLGSGLLLLGLLAHMTGWQQLAAELGEVRWPWLVAMYAVLWMRQAVEARQMCFILKRMGVSVGVGRIFLASQLSSFYSLVMPGEFVSSGAKWANLAAATGKKSTVLNAMLYNRLLQPAVLSAIGIVALIVDDPERIGLLRSLGLVVLAGLVSSVVVLYHPRTAMLADWLYRRVAGVIPRAVSEKIGHMLVTMDHVRRFRRRDHVVVIGFVCVATVLGLAGFVFAMNAVALDVSLCHTFWVFVFLTIARFLPLTVGNLGVREGLLVVMLQPLGVAPEKAILLGLVMFTRLLFMALVGFLYQVALAIGLARWRCQEGV